jgi:hypothetical protein
MIYKLNIIMVDDDKGLDSGKMDGFALQVVTICSIVLDVLNLIFKKIEFIIDLLNELVIYYFR